MRTFNQSSRPLNEAKSWMGGQNNGLGWRGGAFACFANP